MHWMIAVARGTTLLTTIAALGIGRATPPRIGTATGVHIPATIAAPPASGVAASVGSAVFLNNVITTGTGGAVRVLLADSTYFSVGGNASVSVDKFIYNPDKRASQLLLSITRGAFRFVSGKPTHAYPGQSAIATPAAVIGIRGTIVSGIVGPEAAAFYADGKGAAVADDGNGNATLIVLENAGSSGGGIDIRTPGSDAVIALRTRGQAVFFSRPGAPPTPPFALSPNQQRALDARAAPQALGRDPRGSGQNNGQNAGQRGGNNGDGGGQQGRPGGGGAPGPGPGSGGPPR
jgi:hypothetical protein